MYVITMNPEGVRPVYFSEWLGDGETIAGSNIHLRAAQAFVTKDEAIAVIRRMHPAQQANARVVPMEGIGS